MLACLAGGGLRKRVTAARLRRVLIFCLILFSAAAVCAPARVEILQSKLNHPWSLAFLPGKAGILITLRNGQLLRWQPEEGLSGPIAGVPKVWAHGQGGLLDVVLAPDFAASRRVWLSFAEGDATGKAGTAVGYGRLSEDMTRLEHFTVVFRQTPKLSTGNHFGGSMAFDAKGFLYIALGENNQRNAAQDLSKLQGKVVRLTADGRVPQDNPFVGRAGVRPEIWAYGIRNAQGMALNPFRREIWMHEHGPRGGDEINIAQAGKNYGWPIATWGVDYSGEPYPETRGGEAQGVTAPVYYWKVSPAISGMAFYNSDVFPQWKYRLFIGALKQKALISLKVEGRQVSDEQRLLTNFGQRIRSVRVGPDGYVYVLTDESDGQLLKVSPKAR
ncbi:PQQ-dependent sugar dehydrogenase [Enterobacteriaceae bacterium YMB-R22]|jgi:glucose/arabinose dehydrogenase|nr:PQQ-dependent sugar dehydrogenase [Tenebrionicola larvae]MBV4412262.1 PQQ-dependent sugar dehydrogenase [Tenebrionicola larvae]